VAFDVLTAISSRDAYANLLLPSQLRARSITGRDAAFATELTYGTLRGLGTYDAVIARCSSRPIDEIDPNVRAVLQLGAHQLFAMNVPTHAAVASSVELAKQAIGRGPSGFVNAVMRRMATQDLDAWLAELVGTTADPASALALRYSHPEWMVTAFHEILGSWSDAEAALRADNESPTVTLAAWPGRSTVDELIAAGAIGGRWSARAAYWPSGDPGQIPAVRDRRAGVQDEGSQLVALALATAPLTGPDSTWLDMCAGPGGKAALLGGLAAERGARLTAVELQGHRAELVRQAVDESVRVVTADATDPRWADGSFDRVLVDVPCSGIGALRRRPEARWRRRPEDVDALRPLQHALLLNALSAVRPGGVVGYVTCSPLPAETCDLVAAVVADRSYIERLDARPMFPEVPDLGEGPDVQLWPHRQGTDAMYLSLLRRHERE
jgi:16S rRNA (cytosine967-C5)-methyltransferase